MIIVSGFLQTNTMFQEFEFSQNTISAEDMELIIEAIQGNATLQMLDISSNNISDDGAVAISECLKNKNISLQKLNMSHNKISDKGITIIGKALQENTTLKIFDISHNSISDNGVLAFSKCINTLHQLRISWNNIYLDLNYDVTLLNVCQKYCGNTGEILIAAFLHHNTSIQELDISHNNICDNGAIAISECLKNNCTLYKRTQIVT